jgi:CDP-diacylglycerol---glycerol-3-phosphate 3-phosphatidyltransferase
MTVPSGATPSRGAAFRAAFRARIEGPVARVFIRTHLTPNMLTLIGFAIAVIGAWLAAIQLWLIAGVIVAFGAVFDLFDGALARATGKSSKLGAFLDSTFDRAGEAVVYIGIALGLILVSAAGTSVVVAIGATVAAMGAAFMVSYTRAKSESLGFSSGTGMANIGLAPREVRTAVLSLALMVAGLLPTSETTWWTVLVGALGLIAILATITTIQRILFVYQQSTKQEVTR